MTVLTNTIATTSEEPMTVDKLLAAIRKATRELGPPPLPVKFSRYAEAYPTARPRTLDMQLMVERLGRVRVPAAFRVRGLDGRFVIIAHPDLFKGVDPNAN